jgi:hypothetical protein
MKSKQACYFASIMKYLYLVEGKEVYIKIVVVDLGFCKMIVTNERLVGGNILGTINKMFGKRALENLLCLTSLIISCWK